MQEIIKEFCEFKEGEKIYILFDLGQEKRSHEIGEFKDIFGLDKKGIFLMEGKISEIKNCNIYCKLSNGVIGNIMNTRAFTGGESENVALSICEIRNGKNHLCNFNFVSVYTNKDRAEEVCKEIVEKEIENLLETIKNLVNQLVKPLEIVGEEK
ncbi:MAG: hypothetical protein PHO80_01450 [Candidatus Gracilibacteria bacterium]|nr:hypothetical protein [Candidatus Gracilibacteria bacterium]